MCVTEIAQYPNRGESARIVKVILMQKTVPVNYAGKKLIGYGVGSYLSQDSQRIITSLLAELTKELPDVLWMPPLKDLHITLFEVVVSLAEYDEDRDELYEKHRPAIEHELERLLARMEPITVNFNQLQASEAAIIVRGTDDGRIQTIRDRIVSKGLLPHMTKLPPDIIHSTIARYTKAVDVDHVQEVLRHHSIDFKETIREFKLEKATGALMEGVETLKVYPLVEGKQ
jgi:hypothetical protein